MTTQEIAQKVIDAVQFGHMSPLTCSERLERMEAQAHNNETLPPFATAADLLECCAIIRVFLSNFEPKISQAEKDISRYNTGYDKKTRH